MTCLRTDLRESARRGPDAVEREPRVPRLVDVDVFSRGSKQYGCRASRAGRCQRSGTARTATTGSGAMFDEE
jgi:hypothetical protein